MWLNAQETADLVTFTEEILNGNFIFFVVQDKNDGYSKHSNDRALIAATST